MPGLSRQFLNLLKQLVKSVSDAKKNTRKNEFRKRWYSPSLKSTMKKMTQQGLKLSFEYPLCFGFQISAYEKAKSKELQETVHSSDAASKEK